jgi:8-oxo-dGTP diphosphatase
MMDRHESMSLGFLFDTDLSSVLLVRKTHPQWQAGKLNGVGGHAESADITFVAAMRRKCLEETGIDIPEEEWTRVAELEGFHWMVVVFCAIASRDVLLSATVGNDGRDEKLELVPVGSLGSHDTTGNTRWLVLMAADRLSNPNAFRRAIIQY